MSYSAGQSVILLTGGSDGFGREAAKIYVSHNWRVVITGRSREKLEMVVSEIKQVPTIRGFAGSAIGVVIVISVIRVYCYML